MSYYERIIAAELKAESIRPVTRPVSPIYEGLRDKGPEATVELGLSRVDQAGPEAILVATPKAFAQLWDEILQHWRPELDEETRQRRVRTRTRYATERLEAAHQATGALGWIGARACLEGSSVTWLAVDIPRRAQFTALELASVTAAPTFLSEFDKPKLRSIGYEGVQEVGRLILAHNVEHPDHELWVPRSYDPREE